MSPKRTLTDLGNLGFQKNQTFGVSVIPMYEDLSSAKSYINSEGGQSISGN